ncbi:hypothetical protein AHAS_Ahas05G0271500 [Arachis hypogaea]
MLWCARLDGRVFCAGGGVDGQLVSSLLSSSSTGEKGDLSHVFSSVRRDLNFIDHTSDLGSKESDRIEPIVVDPAIYLSRRSKIFQATQKRKTPESFKIFTGKSILSYSVSATPSLQMGGVFRESFLRLQEGYFHSVICNTPEFKNTTVNGDLRYMIWDNPPQMEPQNLNISDYNKMVESGAAFARQFRANDPVLDMIDEKILHRGRNQAVPGAWCSGLKSWWRDPCSNWGDVNVLRTGPQAKKLEESVSDLLDNWNSQTNQCNAATEYTQE